MVTERRTSTRKTAPVAPDILAPLRELSPKALDEIAERLLAHGEVEEVAVATMLRQLIAE